MTKTGAAHVCLWVHLFRLSARGSAALLLTASVLLAAPAARAAPAQPEALLQRAIAAMGGARLEAWRTLRVEGATVFYDPEQSPVPGGEPRRGADAEFVRWRELDAERSRTEWRSRAMRPVERRLAYTEVIGAQNGRVAGYVKGLDSMLSLRSALAAGEHRMSAMRVDADRRDLLMTSPKLLVQMLDALRSGATVRLSEEMVVGPRRLPALSYASPFGDIRVAFDPASGLPERLRVLDYDPIQADSDFDLAFSDWRSVGGVQYPFKQVYTLNGKLIADSRIAAVQVDPALPPESFTMPDATDATAALLPAPAAQNQWVIRKQGFGVLMDSDAVVWDTGTSVGMSFTPLGPSVWLISGGFYNTLLVELEDSLVVYDAPNEAASQWILRETAQRFPGKPIKHVVLTHYHMDHAGGLRSYVAQGATLVVGQGTAEHLRRALKRPVTQAIAPLRAAGVPQALAAARIVEIDGPFSLGNGAVKAQAYPVQANDHAEGMLFGYVPGARLGFVSDLWSPGRGPLPPVGSETHGFLLTLVRSVKAWKLDPERFAGGHGSVGDYVPAARLVPD